MRRAVHIEPATRWIRLSGHWTNATGSSPVASASRHGKSSGEAPSPVRRAAWPNSRDRMRRLPLTDGPPAGPGPKSPCPADLTAPVGLSQDASSPPTPGLCPTRSRRRLGEASYAGSSSLSYSMVRSNFLIPAAPLNPRPLPPKPRPMQAYLMPRSFIFWIE